jgi:predicted CXXCH cytochrome family protein
MRDDVHAKRGLSCASCHGGDPKQAGMDAHDRRAGFVGAPPPTRVPEFCASCHSRPDVMRRFNPKLPTDQFARYLTSVHGQKLRAGDTQVATCVSCHGVHPVRGPADSASPVFASNVPRTCAQCHADVVRMKPYGIPTTQFDEYRESVHGQALLQRGNRQAPACNDCHDNHGAVPPGVTSVANVCAQCHSATRDLFVRSPHKEAFDVLGQGECTTCHGTHTIAFPTDEMIGGTAPALCLQCHPAGSSGIAGATAIRAGLERLKGTISEAEGLLRRADRAGMDVSESDLEINEARTQLIIARAATHAASVDAITPPVQAGVAAAGRARMVGEAALAELAFRKRGLGIALVVIGFVALTLWLKLRELESRPRP